MHNNYILYTGWNHQFLQTSTTAPGFTSLTMYPNVRGSVIFQAVPGTALWTAWNCFQEKENWLQQCATWFKARLLWGTGPLDETKQCEPYSIVLSLYMCVHVWDIYWCYLKQLIVFDWLRSMSSLGKTHALPPLLDIGLSMPLQLLQGRAGFRAQWFDWLHRPVDLRAGGSAHQIPTSDDSKTFFCCSQIYSCQ